MFDLSTVQENENIPIPMGTPENIGVSDFYITDIKVIDPTEKAGYSLNVEFEYRGDRKSPNGVPHKGAKVSFREFDPTFSSMQTEEQKKKSIEGSQQRVKHLLGRFLSDEQIAKVKGENFKDFITVIAQGLPNKAKGVNCTLKLIYNRAYVSFPRYGAFISTEFSPKEFKYDGGKYDHLTPQGGSNGSTDTSSSSSSDFTSDFTAVEEVKSDIAPQNDAPAPSEDDDPFA